MSTVETSVGEVFVSLTGRVRSMVTDEASYFDVGVRVGIGLRSLAGEVSVGTDGCALGDTRDAWVSSNVLNLLEEEVPSDEQRAVLDEIEALACRMVLDWSMEVES